MSLPNLTYWTKFISSEVSGASGYKISHNGTTKWIMPTTSNGKICYRAEITGEGLWFICGTFDSVHKAYDSIKNREP
jgi:hypothetical protein